jgi:DNA-binding NtrC family response regulator
VDGVNRALVVHDQDQPFGELERVLQNLHIEVVRARTCSEAFTALHQDSPPNLVFTDVTLPDGTWKDMLRGVAGTPVPADVILVSRIVDDGLYISALESGALDFVVPPFGPSDVAHVIGHALRDIVARKVA